VTSPLGTLRVHVDSDTGLTRDDTFRTLVESSQVKLDVTYAETDRPFDLLVAARPSEDLVVSSPRLRVLLVPLAGVPETTWHAVAGVPHVDVHTSHFNAQPAAEMAVALMLSAAKGIVTADARMRELDWTPRFMPPSSILFSDRRAVVIGFGAIGSRIAHLCRGLGMRVDAVRRRLTGPYSTDDGVHVHEVSSLPDLLAGADVVFVAVALNQETKGLLGDSELAFLHAESILVTVSRPEIVDEQALFDALSHHRIGGAALDMWSSEPASVDDAVGFEASSLPFHDLSNVVLSPHRAGGGGLPAVRQLRRSAVVDFIEAAALGRPLPHREHRP
jgi:phosphoglycerate dehydrogenase-like enzyme